MRRGFQGLGDVFELVIAQRVFERCLQAAHEQQRFALGDDAQVYRNSSQPAPPIAAAQTRRVPWSCESPGAG